MAIIEVHLQPGAKREGIIGEHGGALKVAVRAKPKEGEANEALCRVLAKAFDVPKSAVEIVAGHTHRRKRVRISGDEAQIERMLAQWLQR